MHDLLQGCTLQELSLLAQTTTEVTGKMERDNVSEHMSDLTEGALQLRNARVMNRTGAAMSWPSAWHE